MPLWYVFVMIFVNSLSDNVDFLSSFYTHLKFFCLISLTLSWMPAVCILNTVYSKCLPLALRTLQRVDGCCAMTCVLQRRLLLTWQSTEPDLQIFVKKWFIPITEIYPISITGRNVFFLLKVTQPKPEILISPKVWQISSKFQRQT